MRIRRSPILTGALLMMLSFGLAAAQAPVPEKRPTLSVREIVERFGRAVVTIEAESEGQAWQGSGFVVGAGGAIVTNLHVLENASEVKVSFSNDTHIDEVTVSAFDVERDLAVFTVDIRADMTQLSTVDLGDPSSVKPGDPIFVIGSPMGLERTVTEGIVSAWREEKGQAAGDAREASSTR
jgi:S1-C subfamily serine protease